MSNPTPNISAILEAIVKSKPQDLLNEWDELKAIRAWARKQASATMEVGDRVRIDGFAVTEPDLIPYRECLADGSQGTVQRVWFNQYVGQDGEWRALVLMDKEWEEIEGHRFWRGMLEEKPDGMESYAGSDGRAKRHEFPIPCQFLKVISSVPYTTPSAALNARFGVPLSGFMHQENDQ